MHDGQTNTDEQLLRAYTIRRDEAAFAQLVQRHLNLVFSTALRLLGDRSAAEEIAQNVFISLARKATSIRPDAGLAGWLHRAAILEARLRQRTDLRRQSREDLAAQLGTTMTTPDAPDDLPFALLDDALLELPEKDRRTLLLRYFEQRPFRDIANTLGIGEDTAQKRASRALEALAGILRRRGATTITGALAAKTLEAAALSIAPTQLATSITSIALAAAVATSSVTTLAILAAKLMTLTKTQTAAACLLLAAAPVGYQWHAASSLRQAAANVARDLASITEALARAEADAKAATRRLDATSTRLAETRSLLRRANDQISTSASTPEASLYLWSDTASHVRIPKSIAPRLRLSGSIDLPTAPGFKPVSRAIDAVDATGDLSEPLTEALGITPEEAAAIHEAFARTASVLEQQVHANAYLTNQVPAQFRTDGNPAAVLVTPALPDRGEALRETLRQSLTTALSTERAALVWQQAERTFENEFNQFGGVGRIQAAVFNGPGNLALWTATLDAEGTISSWGNNAGNLSLDTFPARLQPIVAEWLTPSPDNQP